ncbi:MAG: helix-turn-helix domain-containing protein [Prevotella sp.]|nr:helix-turn-helix domain-containing protein [Prevotella sp.]
MIAELLKQNQGNVQLVVSAADLRELVNEWCDEREALKEAERKSMVEDERISQTEVEKTLGVTSATLWRWAKSGYLVPKKVGRKNIYLKSDIDRILHSK